MKVLVIIPSHNEEARIISLVNEVKKSASNLDYLVINDASTDNTKELLKLNKVNHINLPVNLGLTGATRIGIEYAYENNYDYVMKIDGDGQHNPQAIMYMLKTMIANDLDVVQMSRYLGKHRPLFSIRTLGSRLISLCSLIICFRKMSDPTNGCHLYNRTIIEKYNFDPNMSPEPDTLCRLIKEKYKVQEVQYDIRPRTTGTSFFNMFTGILYMLEICISILFVVPFQKSRKFNKTRTNKKNNSNVKFNKRNNND